MSKLTHIAGTFVIHADASFLNGAGLGDGEDRNVTVPKTLRDGKRRVPYVSAQAWKRWLRETFIEETGYPQSVLKSIKESAKGSTAKIAGELDPVGFPEDDIFGYMRAQEGQGKKADPEAEPGEGENDAPKAKKAKAVMRTSPFAASILVSLRKDGWQGRDEGFVHLKEGTPLPYTTEFYTTHLQGVFSLAYQRLGVFENEGDRIELDEAFADKYLKQGAIEKAGNGYRIVNAAEMRKERAGKLLQSLAVLRGGAKQAAFGTDVAPKCLLLAGLSCGNPILNHLFEDDPEKGLSLKIAPFQQILADYADRIVTPVFVGFRSGYLRNQDEVQALAGPHTFPRGQVTIEIGTPRETADRMSNIL